MAVDVSYISYNKYECRYGSGNVNVNCEHLAAASRLAILHASMASKVCEDIVCMPTV